MKKFITTLALAAAVSVPSFGQELTTRAPNRGNLPGEEMDQQKFERVVDNYMDVKFRENAINYLGLNSEEIEDFTPIFLNYVQDADKLDDRRSELVEEYREEMAEDDSRDDERGETAEFIEDYWQIDIDKMQLKNDYFDRLEDAIGFEKALQFFSYEEAVDNRVKRLRMMNRLPSMVAITPSSISYQNSVDSLRSWKKINIDGKVALDHEFTSTGLMKLTNTIERMAKAEGITINNLDSKLSMIRNEGNAITENWKSLSHANSAKKAFTKTAELLEEVANDSRYSVSSYNLSQLKQAAMGINVDQKLTDQSQSVYNFFDVAESIVNDLAEQDRSGDTMRRQMMNDRMMKSNR